MNNSSSFGPENLSKDLHRSTLFISVIVGIYAVVGLFGNASVFYVYLFRYPKCNFKYFVVSLAIIDIISCITTLPGEIVTQTMWFSFADNLVWLCKVKTFFNGYTVFVSAFILLLIAVDRFCKVCRPLKRQIRPKLAIQLSSMIFLIAVVLATPALYLWGKQTAEVQVHGHNMTVTMCEKSDETKNTIWPRLFAMLILVAPTLVFMIATVVLYGLIMKEIFCGSLALKNISSAPTTTKMDSNFQNDSKVEDEPSSVTILDNDNESEDEIKANKKQKAAPTASDKSYIVKKVRMRTAKLRLRRKTMIMFVLTVTFTITTCIYFVILFKVSKSGHTFVLDVRDRAELLFFFWRLYFINHVINPFVYGIMDNRFRETVIKAVCRRK